MAFIICNNTVNGYELGCNYSPQTLSTENLYFEFDSKNPHKLITISTKNILEFYLNGTQITFEFFKNMLEKQKDHILIEHFPSYTSYIIPDTHLVVNITQGEQQFSQVLAYDVSLKHLYEDRLNSIQNHQQNQMINLFNHQLKFEPYTVFDQFSFGMHFDDFIKILQQYGYQHHGKYERGLEVNKLFFHFREHKFSQVLLDKKVKRHTDVFIENQCISSKKDIIKLQKMYSYITRREGRIVFPELGFSVDQAGEEFYFFSQDLLAFWSNPHRPITSW